MIEIPQNKTDLEQLIHNKIEESANLEYKGGDALDNTDSKKKEIAKDVSAMANSAGGVIIYGIKEFDEKDKKHLPERISPIDRSNISKEWLEQVILGSISPKIDNLTIHVVPIDGDNMVCYIVEVPQSVTAHQNSKDYKYYRRRNFLCEPMLDYEIRDIMNRAKYPIIELSFEIEKQTFVKPEHPLMHKPWALTSRDFETTYTLKVFMSNAGSLFAQYINYFVYLPPEIVHETELEHQEFGMDGSVHISGNNTMRDITDFKKGFSGDYEPVYGPSRYDPILPGMKSLGKEIKLVSDFIPGEHRIGSAVYADNAPFKNDIVQLKDVPIIEVES